MSKTYKVVYNTWMGDADGQIFLSYSGARKLVELGVTELSEEVINITNEIEKEKNIKKFRAIRLPNSVSRHDPRLVQVVEELGNDAGKWCELHIATIMDSEYFIEKIWVETDLDDEFVQVEVVRSKSEITWTKIEN